AQLAPVLSCGLLAVLAMGGNQLDAAPFESLSQGIAVRGRVVDESARDFTENAIVEQRLDKIDLVRAGAGDFSGQRNPSAFDQDHDLGPFAAFGLASAVTPFFAEAKVPSAIVSSKSISPSWSSNRSKRAQALPQMPASVHSLNLRQQVVGEDRKST